MARAIFKARTNSLSRFPKVWSLEMRSAFCRGIQMGLLVIKKYGVQPVVVETDALYASRASFKTLSQREGTLYNVF